MHKFNAHIIKCSVYGVTVSSDGLQIPEIIYECDGLNGVLSRYWYCLDHKHNIIMILGCGEKV